MTTRAQERTAVGSAAEAVTTFSMVSPVPIERAVRGIYEASFRDGERRPWDEQWGRFGSGADRLGVAYDAAGEVSGFAITTPLDAECVLLSYLAVDQGRRGSGVGSVLLDGVRAEASGAGCSWLLIEVEPPEGAAADVRWGDPVRRMAFYARHGVVVASAGYGMPDLTKEGGSGLVDLVLLAVPLRPGLLLPSGCRPSMGLVGSWVRLLWGSANYDRPADDAAFCVVWDRVMKQQAA